MTEPRIGFRYTHKRNPHENVDERVMEIVDWHEADRCWCIRNVKTNEDGTYELGRLSRIRPTTLRREWALIDATRKPLKDLQWQVDTL